MAIQVLEIFYIAGVLHLTQSLLQLTQDIDLPSSSQIQRNLTTTQCHPQSEAEQVFKACIDTVGVIASTPKQVW